MSKLAVYDKHTGKDDWKDDVYFRQDYIYSNNMRTRVFIFFGCILLTAFYILHIAAFQEIDLFSIAFYRAELTKIIIFFAATLIFYTFVGTILYTARYAQTQKRLEHYFAIMDKLDGIEPGIEPIKEINDDETKEDDEDDDGFYDYFKPTIKTTYEDEEDK
jgi:hypothetical protein